MYIVATGLLAYDYIITFDREIELFWKRKRSLSSVLFLFNRYLSLVASILSLVKATTAME
ncbi:hypothetical protein C8Q74DRAFT_1303348 [Fomes fomentarius]|nr:hypothetical protein C8Q74DRAFT_1303348 [Fomes fomentarius]